MGGALLATLTGCSSRPMSVSSIESTNVSKITFEIVSYVDSDPYQPIPAVPDLARITFNDEMKQIEVIGRMLGGGECHEIYLSDASLNNDSLVLELEEKFIAYPWSGCPGAMTSEIYYIVVKFADELPESVTVNEKGKSNKSTTKDA